MLGVEKYTENLLEEALQLLTVSYVVNERIGEEPPTAHNPPCKVGPRGLDVLGYPLSNLMKCYDFNKSLQFLDLVFNKLIVARRF